MAGCIQCRIPFLLLLVAGTCGRASAQIPVSDDQGRTATLIRQLGDERTREAAEKALFAIGGPALQQLRTIGTRRNPEIRTRADRLIARITTSQSPSLGTTFSRVTPGEFFMGSANNEQRRRPDEVQHPVRITQPFLIATREVTQDEYRVVMGAQPSWFSPTGGGYRSMGANFETGRFPVDSVTWFDAIEFCNRLSRLDGYDAYYSITHVTRPEHAIVNADVSIVGGTGYRLPTEAEWEYACRAGTTTSFHFVRVARGGNFQHAAPMGVYGPGWHNAKRTTSVAKYKSNSLDIFDMHGNVAEWCWDRYDKEYYAKSPRKDPTGPRTGARRVLRGGTFELRSSGCRSAARSSSEPGSRKKHIGFRIARTPAAHTSLD